LLEIGLGCSLEVDEPARRTPWRPEYRYRCGPGEELQALIDGRLGNSDERSALLRLATRLIVEEALEAEVEDALGRGYYEHGAAAGAGYRNGYRTGRLKSTEGPIAYAAQQVASRGAPFRSALRESLKAGPRHSRTWRWSCSPAV
jgi:hypothetical protein